MRKWLPYFEAVILIALIVLIVLNTKRGGATVDPPPASQAAAFIKQGDEYFAKQGSGKKPYLLIGKGFKRFEMDTGNLNHASRLHAHLRVSEIYFHSNWVAEC